VVVAPQFHAGADDLEYIHDPERILGFVGAQLAMVRMDDGIRMSRTRFRFSRD
jgi:hypothetical protein